jgi:hypothetical protein
MDDDWEFAFELEHDARSWKMSNYIEHSVTNKIPLVALCQNHLDFMEEYLHRNHPALAWTVVHKETEALLCCKHYPFSCEEADEIFGEQSAHARGLTEWNDGACTCSGHCPCDDSCVPKRHYWEFYEGDALKKSASNCYEDCCSHVLVGQRFHIRWD